MKKMRLLLLLLSVFRLGNMLWNPLPWGRTMSLWCHSNYRHGHTHILVWKMPSFGDINQTCWPPKGFLFQGFLETVDNWDEITLRSSQNRLWSCET